MNSLYNFRLEKASKPKKQVPNVQSIDDSDDDNNEETEEERGNS